MRKILTNFQIFYIFLFLLNTITYAQQFGLSITPPHLEVIIKPDKSILVAYTVRNFGDPIVLKANVYTFSPKDNYGNIDIKQNLEGPVRFYLDNADISLNQPFFLNSKQDQQLLLRIRIPEGAPEGDYYYTLLAETVPNPSINNQSGSQTKGRIGSNILITVSREGRIDLKGSVSLFDILPRYKIKLFGNNLRILDSSDPIPVVLMLENKGKNMIKPNGDIVLRGNFGEKATFNILPQNILSESQRQILASPSAEINCDVDKKPFYCLHPSSFIITGFFLGKYNLSTTINFGEGSPNIYSTVEFLALPIKFSIGLLAVVIITLFILKIQKQKDKD